MNGIERVRQTIQSRPVSPIVRGELTLDSRFVDRYLSWRRGANGTPTTSEVARLIACCRELHLDLVCLQAGEASLDGATRSKRLTQIGSLLAADLFVFWVVNGAFQTLTQRRGLMTLMTELVRSPEDVGRQLKEVSKKCQTLMGEGIAAGAHGVIIADDIAYTQNTYMSPAFVEAHLLPIWKNQVAAAGELGVPVFFHSDGNLNGVLPAIAAAGFDGLQCMEPAAGMDIGKIMDQYGRSLCLMGNLDPALLCLPADPSQRPAAHDRLQKAAADLIASAGRSGGFIFGTCSGLHAGMSPELVHTMAQVVSARGSATDQDREEK